ncbi:hypothetical protein [Paraburkholderia tuberum]|uniref:Uncharacterized protein n=1 Tax=Paraburkholderia tuberum TaxID=157910 RepID=A0A1H1G9V4_9BURK|nr:hypothetical protein [Paraburkholderia tuberum]SDR10024.1 hypothetical protein SAMN05445850_2789 [Paraburkholderia tuberum]
MKSEAEQKRFWDKSEFQIVSLGIGLAGLLSALVALLTDFFKIQTIEMYFLVVVAAAIVLLAVSWAFRRTEMWSAFCLLRDSIFLGKVNSELNALLSFLEYLPRQRNGFDLFERVRLGIEVYILLADDPDKRNLLRRKHRAPVDVRVEPVVVNTIGEIYDKKDEIADYFRALGKHKPARVTDERATQFLVPVVVIEGFLAAHYLVAGLLPELNEEWQPAILDYGRAMTDPFHHFGELDDGEHGSVDLRELQAFQFICWLAWGPSIPICTCSRWRGKVGFQFGYGDEDVSIPLFASKSDDGAWAIEYLKRSVNKRSQNGASPLAFQTSVTGRLRWDSHDAILPDAQRHHSNADGNRSRLLLECLDEPIAPRPDGGASTPRYFSAYVWILFVICDKDGDALWPRVPKGTPGLSGTKAQVWRGLLPFFEHANIANGDNYLLLKKQVARKALAVLADVCRDKRWDAFTFRYVSALDDTGCREGEPAFSVAPKACDLMKSMLDEFPGLAGRVLLERKVERYLSACCFPDIVRDYYATVPLH